MSRDADAVPRRMLDLCKDTLRRCLHRHVGQQAQIDALEAEVARLRQILDRR